MSKVNVIKVILVILAIALLFGLSESVWGGHKDCVVVQGHCVEYKAP